MLFLAWALAADAPTLAPQHLELAPGGKVLMDGKPVDLKAVKPILIANPGSQKRARGAKAFSTVGTVTAIAGAALVVVGGLAISGDNTDNTPGYGTAGAGFVLLGTGLTFKIGSHNKWRRSVKDYTAP